MNRLVIKVGGALLDSRDAVHHLFAQIQQLQSQVQITVVHGGGALTENLLSQLGFVSEKINGLRVTPAEQMPIVAGALAGTANKILSAHATVLGLNPVGLSLIDGNAITCTPLGAEYGAVGVPSINQCTLLDVLLKDGFLPIVSSIGCDAAGQLLNVNADHAATAIAELLNAQLVMLSDVSGVLNENNELLKSLDGKAVQQLLNQGVISGGMSVKINAAFKAAKLLGQPVIIGSWHDSLTDILNAVSGTHIIPSLSLEKA
ncbi:acetylglutamate kinase [Alteromonas sp. ASW11-130]|uniref:acetylglutamate kinase n=1 Tax=Alteromonas sp. ASW11-130 TaxID=3015775 RepID=UPI002241BDD0|nr:acetylglutamate kinase [Alteromonas sp. ASW11-130]MCW8090904.1 acetylglutamate kinase [Alteromonas sp. ASW11-130]